MTADFAFRAHRLHRLAGTLALPYPTLIRFHPASLCISHSIENEEEAIFLVSYKGGFRPISWAGGSTESRPTRKC
jgi:hypothetical protein